ncbi:hypothetical protein SAMN05421493_13223 [Pseudobutyrivibrio sp. 49]|nr:hypothetical protein SAMN05421493_13223 [Pseudobutyrivibrio sp. 49]
MEDPSNMARLKMKLSYNQRMFIDALKEAANTEDDSLEAKDKLLLFKEAILLFNNSPEFVPNAPIDVMRQGITFKNNPDDFEELIVMLRVWINSVKKSRKPTNRLAIGFARWNKLPLYVAFVLLLSSMFSSGLHLTEALILGHTMDYIKQIAIVIGTGYLSYASGRGIYYKILAENDFI